MQPTKKPHNDRRPRPAMAAATCALALIAWLPAPAFGQSRWDVSDAEQTVKFRESDRAGMGLRLPLDFTLIGHESWTLLAEAPEPGVLEIELLSPDSLAVVGETVWRDGRFSTPITLKVPRVLGIEHAKSKAGLEIDQKLTPQRQAAAGEWKQKSRDAAGYLKSQGEKVPKKPEDVRKAYIHVRTYDLGAEVLRSEIDALVARREKWINETADVAKLKGVGLADLFRRLRSFELAATFLEAVGVNVPVNPFEDEGAFLAKVDAVHFAATGEIRGKPKNVEIFNTALTADEKVKLNKALSFHGMCIFRPGVDRRDPNSLWQVAQGVNCQLPRVATVRVIGKLDPNNHDRCDWWLLRNYDPQAAPLTAGQPEGFKIEQPYFDNKTVRLRVVATGDKAVQYTFEFRSRAVATGAERVAVIYEVPVAAEAKFPY